MYLQSLLFLDISGGEFLIIILAVFLIFGPKKMPEIARKIGRTMNELKKASSDITREFREETSGIVNELNTARESLKRGSDAVVDEITDTGRKLEKELHVAGQKPEEADDDPYGLNKDNIPDDQTAKPSAHGMEADPDQGTSGHPRTD